MKWNMEELTATVENLELHHATVKGWLRPDDLREVLRLMFYCLQGCLQLLGESDDK